MSEAKLAAASGVSFGAVHQYGLGLRLPSYAAVVKLSRALGVDCTAFQDCEDVGEEETPAAGKKGKPKAVEPPPAAKVAKGKAKKKGS